MRYAPCRDVSVMPSVSSRACADDHEKSRLQARNDCKRRRGTNENGAGGAHAGAMPAP